MSRLHLLRIAIEASTTMLVHCSLCKCSIVPSQGSLVPINHFTTALCCKTCPTPPIYPPPKIFPAHMHRAQNYTAGYPGCTQPVLDRYKWVLPNNTFVWEKVTGLGLLKMKIDYFNHRFLNYKIRAIRVLSDNCWTFPAHRRTLHSRSPVS